MSMKKIIAITACLLMLPMAALAAHKVHTGPSKAAIDACAGKAAGAEVELPGMKGKMIPASCQEMKGKLVAVPTAQK